MFPVALEQHSLGRVILLPACAWVLAATVAWSIRCIRTWERQKSTSARGDCVAGCSVSRPRTNRIILEYPTPWSSGQVSDLERAYAVQLR